MVGGAARTALVAALLTLAIICVSGARGEVTLDTASAEKSGEGLAVNIETTGPASFKIDRFTMGDWVYVWSPQMSAPEQERAVPVDLPAGSGLVSKVSQSRDGKRNGLRIYIGKNADARDILLIPRKSGVRVIVPPARPRVADAVKATRGVPSESVEVRGGLRDIPVADFQDGAGTLDYPLHPIMPPTTPPPADVDSTGDPIDETTPEKEQSMRDDPVAPAQRPHGGRNPEGSAPAGKGANNKPGGRTTESNTGRISTSGAVESSFAPARISMGMIEPARVSGKEDLRNVMIDFFEVADEPLNSAIQLLIAPTKFNIIVDSTVGENSVSLSFKDGQTDLKSALDLLSRTYGLEYVVESGTIVVAARDKVFGNLLPFETRLFVMSWAHPRSVRDILISTGVLAEDQVEYYGGETEYPSVNDSTALSDTGEEMEGDILPIETDLSSTPRNAVLVHGTPDKLAEVALIIGQLDRKPMQIQLEVRVCEANEAAIKELGITTDTSVAQVFQEVGSAVGEDDDFPFSAFEGNQLGSLNRTGGLSFQAVLHAEEEAGNIRVLSQPTITTTDGKQAIWFAGESVPYIAEPQVSTGSNFQAPKVKFIKVGVTLSFKPRLDRDGLITIDANPIVSSLTEFIDLGAGASAPRIQNRQSHSTVRVHDGQTFSLAGLITENERKRTIKVPLLGDLPVVGSLFRDKRTERNRTEIIVLVTPKIVE
jgi:hypothetical protein